MSGDPEFDEFLKRRRPLFRGDVDDGLEPPAELDRIVLRQAREAIEGERPMKLFNMPRWAAPVAIAATLVLGLSVVFRTGLKQPPERIPEVRVENAAQRIEAVETAPGPAEAPVAAPQPGDGPVIVDLASPMSAQNSPPPPPAAAPRGAVARTARPGENLATASTPAAAELPAWRRDAQSWQAEIQRLRASGDVARADAEQAEFNRQFRAYAVSPDR